MSSSVRPRRRSRSFLVSMGASTVTRTQLASARSARIGISTAAGRFPTSLPHCSIASRIAGWVRASSSSSCDSSSNTIRPSLPRSIRPSTTASGQRNATRAATGWPGVSTRWPNRSASSMENPRSASIRPTSDLPEPIPPPMTIRTGLMVGPEGRGCGRVRSAPRSPRSAPADAALLEFLEDRFERGVHIEGPLLFLLLGPLELGDGRSAAAGRAVTG